MYHAWQAMTEAQGLVINGLLTLLAAIGGVLLGATMFGGRVRDLKSAIAESQAAVNSHIANMDDTLKVVKEKAHNLDGLLGALSSQVGRIEANQAEAEQGLFDEDAADQNEIEDAGAPTREAIFALWHQARDRLEALANNPEIDGRTRAKYFRIDRRSYDPFISALQRDEILTEAAADAARAAYKLRNGFRRRQSPPTVEEYARMRALVDAIPEGPGGR